MSMSIVRAAIARYAQTLDDVSASESRSSRIEREAQMQAAEEQACAIEDSADAQFASGLASGLGTFAAGAGSIAGSAMSLEAAGLRDGGGQPSQKSAELSAGAGIASGVGGALKGAGDVVAAVYQRDATEAQAEAKRAEARAGLRSSLSSEHRENANRILGQRDRMLSALQEVDRARQQSLLAAAR